VRREGRTTLAEPVNGRGTDAAVAALSRALAHLAEEIGAAVRVANAG
jgi:ABC-type uncharacterized transport system auxiliary subunit